MLSPEDIEECNNRVEEFIKDKDPSATLILTDRLKINQCFYHFKSMYKDMEKKVKKEGGEGKGVPLNDSDEETKEEPVSNSKETNALKELVKRLQQEVKRRDEEIAILVQHLDNKKGENQDVPVTQAEEGDDLSTTKKMTFYKMMMNKNENEEGSASKESSTKISSASGATSELMQSATTQDRGYNTKNRK